MLLGILETYLGLVSVASLCDGIRCDMAYLVLNDLFEQNWGHQLWSWGWKKPTTEWWDGAIKAAKQKFPNVIFLAEVYSPWQVLILPLGSLSTRWNVGLNKGWLFVYVQPRLQELGFDYTYDKQLYDRLSWGHLDYTRDWLTHNSPSFTKRSAHCMKSITVRLSTPYLYRPQLFPTTTNPGM